MANKILFRRGTKAKLPALSAGEPAFLTDTRELFVGTGSGNVNMSGSQWYTGTAMSGTSTTTGAYYYSACPQVKLGDIYLNTSNGNVYQCTTAGSGTNAKWTYKGNIKGAAGTNGVNAATIVVAASNSLNKTGADYICDGTADQVEINAAIAALPATGGKVLLLEGTYTISAAIIISKSNVTLEGMGSSNTKITGSFSGSYMVNASASGFQLRNIYLSSSNSAGYLLKPSGNGLITNVYFKNNSIKGIAFDGANNTVISNCYFEGGACCIEILTSDASCIIISNNIFRGVINWEEPSVGTLQSIFVYGNIVPGDGIGITSIDKSEDGYKVLVTGNMEAMW